MRLITGMTAAMRKLAGGDTATAIPARERGDEVGEMAQSVQVFKDNMIETERLRAERAEAERSAEAKRKADMLTLAASFEAAVGEIIETVSSASTELEANATALTRTAETTRTLTTTVAAASEEASTNVQAVASATQEIARNIQQAEAGTTQVASNVTEVSRGANETGAASSHVLTSAQSLAGESNRLKLEVQKLLQMGRAA